MRGGACPFAAGTASARQVKWSNRPGKAPATCHTQIQQHVYTHTYMYTLYILYLRRPHPLLKRTTSVKRTSWTGCCRSCRYGCAMAADKGPSERHWPVVGEIAKHVSLSAQQPGLPAPAVLCCICVRDEHLVMSILSKHHSCSNLSRLNTIAPTTRC